MLISVGKLCQLLDSELSEVVSVIWDEIVNTGSIITINICSYAVPGDDIDIQAAKSCSINQSLNASQMQLVVSK